MIIGKPLISLINVCLSKHRGWSVDDKIESDKLIESDHLETIGRRFLQRPNLY